MKKLHLMIRRGRPAEMTWCANVMAMSEPWLTLGRKRRSLLKLLRNPEREVYVAQSGFHFCGVMVLCLTGAFVGYIQAVCVAPEFRGQGIGTELLQFAEKKVFPKSPNVFLCVSDFNLKAQKFYERLGYQKVGKLVDYAVQGRAEFLLRKTIGPLDGFRAETSRKNVKRRSPTRLRKV